ncbi:hypothetical protein OAX78_02865 [Planctomycetota bacterium]|nr:hypothetical protein [Planctomycetota bacterium]
MLDLLRRRRWRRLCPFVLALVCAAPATAQDELPEEATRREQWDRAHEAVDAFRDALADYGEGLPTPRARALTQAEHRLDADPQATSSPTTDRRPQLHPYDAAATLRTYRSRLLLKLRRLAPTRQRDDTSADDLARLEPPQLTILDVRDLLDEAEDHMGPNVGLGVGLDRSGAFGLGERSAAPLTAMEAHTLIELLEGTATGVDVRGDESLECSAGRLIARVRPTRLRQIEQVLAQLRRDRSGLVELEIRVYRLPPAVFAELREGAASLDDAAETRLATEVAAGRVLLVSSHRVVAQDGQQVAVVRGRQRSYVGDLEVNQTGVVPVLNPVLSVLNEGLVVEVRPIVDRKRGIALLDVALSVTHGSDAFVTREVQGMELSFPDLRLARTSGTASVPLGRGALLGGVLSELSVEDDTACVVYVRPRLVQR